MLQSVSVNTLFFNSIRANCNRKEGLCNMEKRNQRNLFSRECIVMALLRLIKEKPFSSISISELTAKAGVSRVTFYRNYTSKEEVLTSYIHDILGDYIQTHANGQGHGGTFYDSLHVAHSLRYFDQYRDFIDGLIQCGFGILFLNELTALAWKIWNPQRDPQLQIQLTAYVGMLYNLYIAWKDGGRKKPLNDLIEEAHAICEKAFGH